MSPMSPTSPLSTQYASTVVQYRPMPRPRPVFAEPEIPEPWPELLTVREAAALLTVSVGRMRHLQASRFIAFYKIGKSVRFAKSDVLRFISMNRIDAIIQ